MMNIGQGMSLLPRPLAQPIAAPYLKGRQVLLFACVALFQWPISISEGAGSGRVLALLSGAHLITSGSRETHAATVAAGLPPLPIRLG
jgi:hypothetical protein